MFFAFVSKVTQETHIFKVLQGKDIRNHASKILSENTMKEIAFLDFPRVTSLLSLSGICFGPVMEKSRTSNDVSVWEEKC